MHHVEVNRSNVSPLHVGRYVVMDRTCSQPEMGILIWLE